MEALIAYDNVQIYDFQTDEDIILNLDYYMDPIHFFCGCESVHSRKSKGSRYGISGDKRKSV